MNNEQETTSKTLAVVIIVLIILAAVISHQPWAPHPLATHKSFLTLVSIIWGGIISMMLASGL